jgi:Zn-dependent M16 (insulinase) family peptidase
MGKRGRSSGSGQDGEVNIEEDRQVTKCKLSRDLRELKIGTPAQLQQHVSDMERLFNESDTKPDVIQQLINTLPSDSLVNMVDQVNKYKNSEYRHKLLSHRLFPVFLNDIYELRLKVNQAEAFAKSLCAYLINLCFPDEGANHGCVSWRNVSKSLSSAAVRAGEMRAQQEAQQVIQNVQQQANHAIQQAQQQAMQAQGDMQL